MPPPSDGPMPETYHRGRKPFWGIGTGLVVVAGARLGVPALETIARPDRGRSMAPTLLPAIGRCRVPLRRPTSATSSWSSTRAARVRDGEAHRGRPGDRDESTLGADEWWVEGDFAPRPRTAGSSDRSPAR